MLFKLYIQNIDYIDIVISPGEYLIMFVLDPRIERDSIYVTDLSLCQIRLQNDSRFPWVILIPKVENVIEVHDLIQSDQAQLIKESSIVATIVKKLTNCKKVNVANLGNIVSQLHWHVVGRTETDAAWPGPIWGVGSANDYEFSARQKLVKNIKQELDDLLSK